MRATWSMGQLAVTVLSLSPVVSAFGSWPKFLPELDTLVVRQEGSASPSPSPTRPASSTTSGPQSTNLNTGGRTISGSATGSAKGNSTKTGGSGKHTMFNPQDPAGSVVMITPAITDGTQLYKIKDFVTWGWNYTNLQATPTAVDVKISCSAARQTWTLTQNMTFATKGAYTWDTQAFQSANVASPLPVEQYTLLIHDSDGAVTSTPEAGYLAPFSGFIFGLYVPRDPIPLDDFVCATMSSESDHDQNNGASSEQLNGQSSAGGSPPETPQDQQHPATSQQQQQQGSTPVAGPRCAPTYSVAHAVLEKKEDGPGPRCGHTLTAVPAVGEEGSPNYIGPRLILFGGATALEGNSAAPGTPSSAGSAGIRLAGATADVHCYDVLTNKWSRMTPIGEPPTPRAAHVATAVGTMVVIQGGIGPAGLSAEDLHVLDLTQQRPRWHRVVVQGPGPGPRYGHVMALVGQRYLMAIGGNDGKRPLADVWALDTAAKPYEWRKLEPEGEGPPPCM